MSERDATDADTDADTDTAGETEAVPVTVYTRENCSLCVVARETIEETAADLGVTIDLDMVDVDEDPALADEYGERVPYVLIDGHPAFKYEIDERDLRLKLLAAS
jgi:glutaredoxin